MKDTVTHKNAPPVVRTLLFACPSGVVAGIVLLVFAQLRTCNTAEGSRLSVCDCECAIAVEKEEATISSAAARSRSAEVVF